MQCFKLNKYPVFSRLTFWYARELYRLSRRQDGGPATEPATKATKLQEHALTKQETVYTHIQEQEQSLQTYDQLAD